MRWSRAWMSVREALQPVGDELDGARQHHGDDGGGDLVGIDVHLDAVAAADVGADDAHVALGQPHVLGEHALHHVRRLRRVIDGELGAGAVVVGQDRARLQRHAGVAAEVEGGLDDHVGGRERLVDVAAVVDALEAEVVAEIGMDHRRRRQRARSPCRRRPAAARSRRRPWQRRPRRRRGSRPPRRPRPRRPRWRAPAAAGYCGADFMPLRCASTATQGSQCAPRSLPVNTRSTPGSFSAPLASMPAMLRMRMRAAHERHMHHARQGHVVDVLAAAFHQLLGIGARDGLADVGVRPVDGAGIDDLVHGPAFRVALAASGLDRIDDGVVAGAAAVVAGEVLADFLARRVGLGRQQVGGGQQHARRAEAALAGVARDEGVLQVADLAGVRDALDGLHLGAVERGGQHQAAAHDLAVDAHGAGAAHAVLAARVRAHEAEVEAQEIDQVLSRLHAAGNALAVDGQRDVDSGAHAARASSRPASRLRARASSTRARWRFISGLPC